MLEILDPRNIDPYAYEKGLIDQIREFSLLPGKRIGWNYCMDYSWVALCCEDLLEAGMKILDIGCGPGAIHGYLEDRHGVNIIGIDMNRWEKDYVNIEGDFLDENLRKAYGIDSNSVDVIVSISAFEHNPPDVHRALVQTSLDCLKLGGYLISTISTTRWRTRKTGNQWNLSKYQIEEIYGDRFESFEYSSIWRLWRRHREIPHLYRKRYGRWNMMSPPFLSVGAFIRKYGSSPN